MSDRLDDLARTLADTAPIGRRRLLGRAMAAVGLGAGAVVLRGDTASAATKGVTCPPGLTVCGSVCRDVTSNNSNCGQCGTVCGVDSVCRNGACVRVQCTCEPTCPAGQRWCSGACVTTATDANNCGACGLTCPTGQVCQNSACVTPPECTSPASCPSSECASATCVGGRCGQAFVAAGTPTSTQTSGDCQTNICDGAGGITTSPDDTDVPQPSGPCFTGTCVNGSPAQTPMPSGTTCATGVCNGSGQCVQCISADQCPAGYTCNNGTCMAPTCSDGVKNGTETDIDCGGNCPPCANSRTCVTHTDCQSGLCSAGVCSTCPTGQTVCNGTCRTLSRDVNNCGACGTVCPSFANGTSACVNGVCTGTCNTGFANCNGNAGDGCETNIASSISNCGACGNVCSVANGSAVCVNGQCQVGTCNAGFANCNGSAADGCETNLATSSTNCGACGVSCPAGHICSSGRCICVAESSTTTCAGTVCGTKLNNCGTPVDCGTCTSGKTCNNGACV